jgi:hypothetical protein
MRLILPEAEQHRPFQHEFVSVRGATKPVQEPLNNVMGQHKVEGLILLAGAGQEPVAH